MIKKQRELIEILLDNVKPDDWPENLPYAAQDMDCCALWFYDSYPKLTDGCDDIFSYEGYCKQVHYHPKELCNHWNKTIVHRDEFMKRWNERNTQAEAKTPQQLALEKFGTDWHDNEGVQPLSDRSIKIDIEFKNGITRERVNAESSSFKIPYDTPSFTITKWRTLS